MGKMRQLTEVARFDDRYIILEPNIVAVSFHVGQQKSVAILIEA